MERLLQQLLGKRDREEDGESYKKRKTCISLTSEVTVNDLVEAWSDKYPIDSQTNVWKPDLNDVMVRMTGLPIKMESSNTSNIVTKRTKPSQLGFNKVLQTTVVPRPISYVLGGLPPLPRATDEHCNSIECGMVEAIDQRFSNLNVIHSWFANAQTEQLSDLIQQANGEQSIIRKAILDEQSRIHLLFSSVCLPPNALRKYEKVKLGLHNLGERLKLYEDEIKVYMGEMPISEFVPARLVIAEKRNNALYTQRKPFKDRLVVKMEKLPHWTVGTVAPCVASLETPCVQVGIKESTEQADILKMNTAIWGDNNKAEFNAIFFGHGFKRQPNRFRFNTTAEWSFNGKTYQQAIFVNDPDQFVVTSNTNQWGDSEGNLLQNILGSNVITMVALLNTIHSRFLIQTHKKITDISSVRTLSFSDLEWIRNWFHKHAYNHHILSPAISNQWQASTNGFSLFWDWYGQFVYRIRFHKYYRIMWQYGWIIGLVSRDQAENLLRNCVTDTCVLRFSSTQQGRFCISWTRENEPNYFHHTCVEEQYEKSSKTFNIAAYAANLPRKYMVVANNTGFDTTFLCKVKDSEVLPVVKHVNTAPAVIEGYETEVYI